MLSHAVKFVNTKNDWIISERAKRSVEIEDGMAFGNGIHLRISSTRNKRPSSKYFDKKLNINLPIGYNQLKRDDFIKRKVNEALRTEAEKVLLPRLQYLADLHDFDYRSASIAILRSRWGSCDNKANIKLNAYLIQLPPQVIDYVLLHELNHTKNLNHSRKFWDDLTNIFPDLHKVKKELKSYNPSIRPYSA
jgi:predicted metal-dependent hydrolase